MPTEMEALNNLPDNLDNKKKKVFVIDSKIEVTLCSKINIEMKGFWLSMLVHI